MIFSKLVPKEYRPLLQYISPTAFRVVDWRTALSEFLKSSNYMSHDSNLQTSIDKTNDALACLGVTTTRKQVPGQEKINDGTVLLQVYFGQLFLDHGVFLDLRLSRFSQLEDHSYFFPTKIFYRFQSDFRAGLLDLYNGYFLQDSIQLKAGMKKTGLWDGQDTREVQKITKLMFDHFGDALTSPVKLEMEAFGKSFQNLFEYFEEKGVTLPSGFLFLGVYLVTLYLSMDHLDKAYDIKKIYTSTKSQLASANQGF